MEELVLLRQVVDVVIRDRHEILEAFNNMPKRLDVDDVKVSAFLESAERVLLMANGRATQMVFGTLWKQLYPDTPLKELVRASFKFAPSIARILETSDRFVVTTTASGRSIFWLRARYDREHPPLPPSTAPPGLCVGEERAYDPLISSVEEEEEAVAVDRVTAEDGDTAGDLAGDAEAGFITETRAWREVFEELELLKRDLWRFQLGLPLGQDDARADEEEDEEGEGLER